MRSIRKLYLKNAAGAQRGLNGENGIYATDLAGFGFSLGPTYADLSRGFFATVNDANEPQNTLAFTIVLTKDAYTVHQSLMDWLAAAGTLTVVYNPTGKREYCRDVTVSFIQKGELNQAGWLELPCSFTCTTPWYLPLPSTLSMSGDGVDKSMRYDYYYDDDLRYGEDNSASIRTVIAGSGHIPGALLLKFQGAVINPQIRLVGNVTGRTCGICRLSTTLTASDTLEFSTRHEDAYVKRISDNGTVTDLLDALDLSLTPFFHIPVDEPCTLFIESDTPFSGRADILIYYYFRSV